MRLDFGDFCRALSRLLPATDEVSPEASRRMAQDILAVLRALVTFDHSVTFSFCGTSTPVNLFDTFNKTERHVYVTQYLQGPFLLDPFFRASSEGRTGFWRIRELAPDRFFSSDYFRNYYAQTELSEEVGFVVPMKGGSTVTLSLMRLRESRVFSSGEIALLRHVEPLISSLVQRCWRNEEKEADAVTTGALKPEAQSTDDLPTASAGWSKFKLTKREAAIVELVLQGHSSGAIAHRLCIARGTVKVHRRNAYRKLGITSQSELLAMYINRVMHRS